MGEKLAFLGENWRFWGKKRRFSRCSFDFSAVGAAPPASLCLRVPQTHIPPVHITIFPGMRPAWRSIHFDPRHFNSGLGLRTVPTSFFAVSALIMAPKVAVHPDRKRASVEFDPEAKSNYENCVSYGRLLVEIMQYFVQKS